MTQETPDTFGGISELNVPGLMGVRAQLSKMASVLKYQNCRLTLVERNTLWTSVCPSNIIEICISRPGMLRKDL